MTTYYRRRDHAPDFYATYVQESAYWCIDDRVHAPIWTAGTIPDSIMPTLEEISEEEVVGQLFRHHLQVAPQARKPGRWRAVVGYLGGWIVGVAGVSVLGYFSLWERIPNWAVLVVLLLLVCFLGQVATAIGLAFTWSSSGWKTLEPKRLVLRLVVLNVICDVAILVGWGLVSLALFVHGIAAGTD